MSRGGPASACRRRAHSSIDAAAAACAPRCGCRTKDSIVLRAPPDEQLMAPAVLHYLLGLVRSWHELQGRKSISVRGRPIQTGLNSLGTGSFLTRVSSQDCCHGHQVRLLANPDLMVLCSSAAQLEFGEDLAGINFMSKSKALSEAGKVYQFLA